VAKSSNSPFSGDDWLQQAFAAALSPRSDSRRWVIAHSGGLDSQVLLHLAARQLPAGQLLVLHINHQLQAQADQWQQFSAGQAQKLGLSHKTVRVSPLSSSEQDARDARYGAFAELMEAGDCLLLGQHGDDQAETLLFRLLRGSGLRGLGAMPRQRSLHSGYLLRPLLDISRAELEDWARHNQLDWVEDPSNRDSDYDRNFLRNQILPSLKQRWPGLVRQWCKTAQGLQRSEQLLNRYLDADLALLCGAFGELKLAPLAEMDGIQRQHLIRRWCENGSGLLLSASQLDQIETNLIAARVDAQPRLQLQGCSLQRYRGALYLVAENELAGQQGLDLLTPGLFDLGDGQLSIERADQGLKTLDGLRLVRRRGGERCRPVGRGGSCSVKKLLQEHQVPPWLRTAWPLLMAGDEVVAIPGITICENWQGKKGQSFALSWHAFALSERG